MAISITTLSGGNTPADGSDPRTFPAIWNATASDLETSINALDNALTPASISSPVAGEKLVFDGTNWVNLEGYIYVDTVYYTSNDTFTKASYPWLRAIRVKVQGAGGGGGGATGGGNLAAGGAGGAGSYSESFITDIASLSASETVTVGAGGTEGSASPTAGSTGGGSSFGSLVTTNGGSGGGIGSTASGTLGERLGTHGSGGAAGTGDITRAGEPRGGRNYATVLSVTVVQSPDTGNSLYGARGSINQNTATVNAASIGETGAGGGNGVSTNGQVATVGGTGGDGIVIVELYA